MRYNEKNAWAYRVVAWNRSILYTPGDIKHHVINGMLDKCSEVHSKWMVIVIIDIYESAIFEE